MEEQINRGEELWRVFIAIELPITLRRRLKEYIDSLRHTLPDARAKWTQEESLHLTVKFLGEIPVAKVPALSAIAEKTSRAVAPFEVVVVGYGAFPSLRHPSVLWVGVQDPSGELKNYHRKLEDECEKAGFSRERRPFRPHITLAHFREPYDSNRLTEVLKDSESDPFRIKAHDACLIRSELLRDGSRHTVISRYEFSRRRI